jgi:hypothetical protein
MPSPVAASTASAADGTGGANADRDVATVGGTNVGGANADDTAAGGAGGANVGRANVGGANVPSPSLLIRVTSNSA